MTPHLSSTPLVFLTFRDHSLDAKGDPCYIRNNCLGPFTEACHRKYINIKKLRRCHQRFTLAYLLFEVSGRMETFETGPPGKPSTKKTAQICCCFPNSPVQAQAKQQSLALAHSELWRCYQEFLLSPRMGSSKPLEP